jgi:hypothetical protein
VRLERHSGLEALGGGVFEEMVQTPLGNCSINTHNLEQIQKFAFAWSGLKSIVIPPSVIFLDKHSFAKCEWLDSVLFERGSKIGEIEQCAFPRGGLRSIVIPS